MRVLIALDINEADRDEADATYDDIKDGLAARLETFYPTADGYEVRAQLRGMADLTEGFAAFMAGAEVGIDGADEASTGFSRNELEEAWIALQRFGPELDTREAWYEVVDNA